MDPLVAHAQAESETMALVTPEGEWTYADLNRAVDRRQAALAAAGVGAGTRVALHAERSGATVLFLWALWRRGAVAVPISVREPAATVVAQAMQVDAALLITADASVARAAEGRLRTVAPVALTAEPEREERPEEWAPDRPATILYTSGSTGAPKAALHTWANHLYSAKGSNANLPLRRGDRWRLSLPLYHVGGLAILIRCALAGATVVVSPPASSGTAGLQRNAITHVSLVATQFRRVLDTHPDPPPSLRAVLLGGGPIPDALLRRGMAADWPLHTSYGCTEMASQVTTTPPGASLDTLRTAGRRLPHRRLRIDDDGQILVAGAPLCAGYVTADGLDDPRTEDGWYPTGDRGRITADGRLRVEGRMDRMFVSGGENIQPEEIEAALEQVAAVERAVVVPVPDAEYGQRPVAFVRGPEEWTTESLEAAIADRLPGFKIPDAFYPLPDEALENGLKVDRDVVRAAARVPQGTTDST